MNPKFRHSLLHSILFRFHVLGDNTVPNPGFPPYYPESFFDTIRRVHLETPLDVATMSIKEWTQVLTEENLTMDITTTNTRQYKPCRAEIASPRTDWALSWKFCRLQGLGSDLASFNFKLLHKLLVTKEWIHHLAPAASPLCSHCSNANEDLLHALINCDYNQDAGNKVLSTVQQYSPNISGPALLRLELTDLPEDAEFPVTYFASSILMFIWEKRMSKARISLYDIRANLEAKCLLLRKTRLQHHLQILEAMLTNL